MVQKIFRFLYKESSTLHNAAYLLGVFAVLSQVMAVIRDRLLAHIFGAGSSLDIYYAAFRIPDFLFVTIASIVSLSVVVPFIVEKEKESKEAVQKFVNNIFSFFSVLMITSCILAFFLIPVFSDVLFKGFSDSALKEVILLSRILLISPIALGFSNLLGSLTQVYNRFTVYAFAPLLYNLGIILGVVLLAPTFGVRGIVIGVIVGAIMHAVIQIPFVMKVGLLPKFSFGFDLASIKKVAPLSLPRTLTLSMSHVATIFLVSMASLMVVGSISVLSFSMNIQSVPLSIIGVSYSLAAFPTLSRYFADKNISGFVSQMVITSRHIIFWSLPITALFIVLRAQIVRVLLGTGRFDWNDTRLTAAALAIFSVSAVFQCLILLFVRAFYSAGKTKMPFVVNLISAVSIIVISYIFVHIFYAFPDFRNFVSALLKVEDLPGTVVLMLPLGYTVGTIINGILHWIGFEREFRGFSKEVLKSLWQSFAGAVILGYITFVGLRLFAPLFGTSSLLGIFFQGFFAGILGIVSAVIILYLLGSKELKEVWASIHNRFWKTEVIATDPEIV
ncbi:MAG: virulence factor [Parcubacteria bacterium C7867-005]|nr:MAG: virulence factor [Parcubacteria bacterium C7867-005]